MKKFLLLRCRKWSQWVPVIILERLDMNCVIRWGYVDGKQLHRSSQDVYIIVTLASAIFECIVQHI